MPLFDLPKRSTRESDNKIINSTKTVKKSVSTVKSDGVLSIINRVKAFVEEHLGKYQNEYICIQDEQTLIDYIDACINNKYVAIDTETTGLDVIRDTIVGISLYTPNQKSAYIPLNHKSYITNEKVDNQLSIEFVVNQLVRLYDSKPESDMFNCDFDCRVLRKIGVYNIYCTWDCYLAMRVLNENEESNTLKKLHAKYVLDGKEDEFTFGEIFKGITFDLIPIKFAYLYGAHDSIITYEFRQYQSKYLRPDHERDDMRALYDVFTRIEMPCTLAVSDMEDVGVNFDFEYNNMLKEKYHPMLDERIATFNRACEQYADSINKLRVRGVKIDNPINIASTQQLAILLYDVMGLPLFYDKNKRKETRSTSEESLKRFDNDVVNAIKSYRELATIVGTFIDKLPECVYEDGRIHCLFNQYGADTGRFSSKDPNLQNIPSHLKDIRPMFRATEGYVLMSADYSQQEIKGMAQMCHDEGMIQAFKNGKDFYAEIASVAFNYPYSECLEFRPDGTTNPEGKERRSRAKAILLGINYGRGAISIAEQLGCTIEEAEKIKSDVFKNFPAIAQFERDSYDMVNSLGYVTTLWGRKRRLPSMLLPDYEFKYINDDDVLDFDTDTKIDVPEDVQEYYRKRIKSAKFSERHKIFEQANKKGIYVIDNTKNKDYTKVVNARIQGTAADMTKLAMSALYRDERLKELGFRLLIQVHDELIAECPIENAKEVKERFAKIMSEAPGERFEIPISVDVEVTEAWYGKEIEV